MKVAWQAPVIYPTTPSPPIFFLESEKRISESRTLKNYFSDSPRLLKCIMCIFCSKCKFCQENSLCIESEKYLQFLLKAVYPSSLPLLIKNDVSAADWGPMIASIMCFRLKSTARHVPPVFSVDQHQRIKIYFCEFCSGANIRISLFVILIPFN